MLAKQVQTELAQANSVADEVLATMTTVRAHAADDSAKAAYGVKLAKFYILQVCMPLVCMPLPTHTARLPSPCSRSALVATTTAARENVCDRSYRFTASAMSCVCFT